MGLRGERFDVEGRWMDIYHDIYVDHREEYIFFSCSYFCRSASVTDGLIVVRAV